MVKTTKGGKTMNPTDAYRKELRKKELKRVIFFFILFVFVEFECLVGVSGASDGFESGEIGELIDCFCIWGIT